MPRMTLEPACYIERKNESVSLGNYGISISTACLEKYMLLDKN
ncbi:hypothetical protein [Methanosarcina sp. DH2]|nr:hypothetical protein [Methanosarcina sp. DH2]